MLASAIAWHSLVANDPVRVEVFNQMNELERISIAFGKPITMNAKRQTPIATVTGQRSPLYASSLSAFCALRVRAGHGSQC